MNMQISLSLYVIMCEKLKKCLKKVLPKRFECRIILEEKNEETYANQNNHVV